MEEHNTENILLIISGTRPEELKTHNLVKKLKENNVPVIYAFTGQHKNLANKKIYDQLFKISEKKNSNRLDGIVCDNIKNFSKFFIIYPNIKYVLVQGDTTSALAVALSAYNSNIKVIHLEAGLRTYDNKNPYPEEGYRKMISQIADIHLCPTIQAQQNLFSEGIHNNVFVVGNTVIDNLVQYKDKCEYTNKILITLHRRENHHWMDEWFIELDKLAEKYKEYEFILPIHPNPNVQKHKHLLKNVNVIDPLPYDELLNLLVKTRLVITDSGGIQEECSFFNKKCLTCRIVTERPEAIGMSTFMVDSPNKLEEIFENHHNNYEINFDCPFGDGYASEKILKILKHFNL